MPAPAKIRQLVERFDDNLAAYKSGKYNEAQTRQEFINPFFQALGWDMENAAGQSELTKEVIHEDAITVEYAPKAPDYCFRLGGTRRFFVEAKKPSIYLKEDIHPAYQLRRYGWSAKLPLSILTDFEEFAVYDCRIMPAKHDKASQARLWYLTYADYEAQWEAIANVFSRAAVVNGSFEQYAAAHKDKRGTVAVDAAFLQEIERWRDALARNFALLNPTLTRRELNFAVQRTIDRLIFLRICEDRGIEEYGRLMALRNGARVYQRLLTLFYQADDRYNSGIFHFKTERAHPEPQDALTPNLQLDDAVLQDIFANLYYPDSPYEFSVISADLLGQVYEQFLGKVIRLTTGHQAHVEEKPEVKKAGGVYYTPTYIVAYIVKQTVGKLLEEKALSGFETLTGLELTILDPACGSGSFLIGAYQYLLDWHLAQYAREPQKWRKGKRPRLYQSGSDWKLTIDERKRILLAHLYGVDIDSQAVEVTKLALLLKVLEGENEQTISSQMALFRERVLPDLANNIKCGNSLIGSDFYKGKQPNFFDEEELYRINAFNWENEFPEITKSGGFDCIVGNPPYFSLDIVSNDYKDYLQSKFHEFATRQSNIYFFFIANSFPILKENGLLSFINERYYFNSKNALKFRKHIQNIFEIKQIVDFCNIQIFEKVK